jgi:hypothetical protein
MNVGAGELNDTIRIDITPSPRLFVAFSRTAPPT